MCATEHNAHLFAHPAFGAFDDSVDGVSIPRPAERELDIVLERDDDRIIGVEIKTTATAKSSDFAGPVYPYGTYQNKLLSCP
jgi:hypothetical protein